MTWDEIFEKVAREICKEIFSAQRADDRTSDVIATAVLKRRLGPVVECGQQVRELWGRDTSQVCIDYDAAKKIAEGA